MSSRDAQRRSGTSSTTLTARQVFARSGSPQFPERHGQYLYWIEDLPEEGGRLALRCRDGNGTLTTLTAADFSLRTRVHEYGGRCHLLIDRTLWFVNDSDQRLYRQSLDGASPQAMSTPPVAGAGWMLADVVLHPAGRWLIAVGEQLAHQAESHRNVLLAMDITASEQPLPSVVLAEGHDFYAAPRVSPCGTRLCYLYWNHPDMPWDAAALTEARISDAERSSSATIGLTDTRHIDGGAGAAACQPAYQSDGCLVYACDRDRDDPSIGGVAENFWNLHVYRSGTVRRLTGGKYEFGAAHWQFGQARIRPLGNGRILAIGTDAQGDHLLLIDAQGRPRSVSGSEQYNGFAQLSAVDNGSVTLVATSSGSAPSIVSVDVGSGRLKGIVAGAPAIAGIASAAEAIAVPARDGVTVHAWYYPPAKTARADDRLPPVMVLVHGGPTSRAGAGYDPARQFWISRGFALLDVNHRGSTGFGRRYRQALQGAWGIRDVDDVVDTIRASAKGSLIDPKRVVIRGGSAGGYVVLVALTRYPSVFRAGACYYGIGNLLTLAAGTHKFESRYLEALTGEVLDSKTLVDRTSVYRLRSPVHFLDRVTCPMILFHGAKDRVVPPEESREVVRALELRGLQHRYIEYADEGHGFRRPENRIDALEAEAAFLMGVLDNGT